MTSALLLAVQVRELLAELGNTPDEIAETLRRLSITGDRYLSNSCPVANYLNLTTAVHDDRCYVSFSSVRLRGSGRYVAAVPPPVATFARLFDAGDYRDLVEL